MREKFYARKTVRTDFGGGEGSYESARRGGVSYSVAAWLRKFGSIHSRNVGSKLVWDNIAHPYYDQVTAVKTGYPLTSIT